MTKEVIPQYVGFYRPHAPVNWTGEIVDAKGVVTKEPTMTKQEFKEECDVNNIVAAYSRSGIITHLNERAAQGVFTDLPSSLDLQEAMNIVVQAEQAFEALPAKLRERFDNDPRKFMDFVQDPASQEEAIKLGIATRIPETPPPPPRLADEIAEAITRTTGGDGGSPPSKSPKGS